MESQFCYPGKVDSPGFVVIYTSRGCFLAVTKLCIILLDSFVSSSRHFFIHISF